MEIAKSNKTALVLGATGLVGRQVVQALLEHPAYTRVITFGRRQLDPLSESHTHHLIDFDRLEDYATLFEGDDLFSCLGTTRAKAGSKEAFIRVDYTYPLKIARLAKVRQLLLVSSSGADPDSLFFYLRIKGALERAVAELDLWAVHLFRPSLLDGDRKEFRLGEIISARLLRGADFLSGGRIIPERVKPVEDVVVARAMVLAAQQLKAGKHIYESEELCAMASGWSGKELRV